MTGRTSARAGSGSVLDIYSFLVPCAYDVSGCAKLCQGHPKALSGKVLDIDQRLWSLCEAAIQRAFQSKASSVLQLLCFPQPARGPAVGGGCWGITQGSMGELFRSVARDKGPDLRLMRTGSTHKETDGAESTHEQCPWETRFLHHSPETSTKRAGSAESW